MENAGWIGPLKTYKGKNTTITDVNFWLQSQEYAGLN